MDEKDDAALWREYVGRDSEEAFALLVTRHVNKVYSVALRHTRDAHAAEEITQTVFVILARKAHRLGQRVILSGWLYQTARLTSVTHVRGVIRRAHREQEAHMQILVNENEPEVWLEIAPLLDAAMAGLNETDRHAVVLRFFDGKSLKEVGAALGANEEAAKKRVSRALEKLRFFFARHGVHSTTAVIADAISTNAVQAAPLALAKAVSAAATAQGAAASSTSTLLKGTLKLMAWTKLKTAAVAGAVILLTAGTAVVAIKTRRPAGLNAAEAEKMWDQYSEALAISGPATEGAIPAADKVMTNHPPMALIRQSQPRPPGQMRFGPRGRGGVAGVGGREGHLYLGAFLPQVMRYAYGLDPLFPQNRIIVPPELQTDRYDYVDTMLQGGKEALQRELRDQFGLVAKKEMRPNLVLTVKDPTAPGLHQHSDDAGNTNRTINYTMAQVADHLAKVLGVQVTDQTGLAGGFDFTLSPRSQEPDDLKAAILDELGLQLTPAEDNQQNEFLVVEKVK